MEGVDKAMESCTNDSAGSKAYCVPTKQIHTQKDMSTFVNTKAYKILVNFLHKMDNSVVGICIGDNHHVSPLVERLEIVLDRISGWVDEIPPIAQPMRYGNKAFCAWLNRLKETSVETVREILDKNHEDAVIELVEYWKNCWGNMVRIDYGTGHEMFFVAFLCCLDVLEMTDERDLTMLTLKIFNRYLEVMRKIQVTYRLEPAGSHGVWSLDDYQALPFIFGSSQLLNQDFLTPKSIFDDCVIETYSSKYMYLACVKFIKQMKTGLFEEYSPILANSGHAKSWDKVHAGMWRIYQDEVIGKFPVMQHFLFGSLLPFTEQP